MLILRIEDDEEDGRLIQVSHFILIHVESENVCVQVLTLPFMKKIVQLALPMQHINRTSVTPWPYRLCVTVSGVPGRKLA